MSAIADSTQSFFGWLDYDEREAQRMREVFGAFDDKDTIDSLGLGVIRDSMSDQLFPGISTIQTRARYFFFVPWICQILESESVPPRQAAKRQRELELALIESLRGTEGPSQGVIGYRARQRLSRLPSSVYWNGLHVFGIRQLRLSIPEYHSALQRLAASLEALARDDDGELLSAPRRMWDLDLPPAPEGFPFEPISLTLTAEESEYLAGKMMASRPDTLIGELARDFSIDRSAPLPWEVALQSPSSRLVELLRHGCNFSQLMEGPQALYNLLLARDADRLLGRDTAKLQEELLAELEEWAELIQARRGELASWIAGEEFWFVIERLSRVPAPTRRFVLEWADIALANPAGVVDDPRARSIITEREFRLKRKLARLSEPRALENWNGEPFSLGQMTFRWGNARRILDDLQHHEGR